MEVRFEVIFMTLFLFGFVQASVLPVEKCEITNKECLIKAYQKMVPIFTAGMPEYNVKVLDPLDVRDLNIDLAGLILSTTEGVLKGMKNTTIDDIVWNKKKRIITIDFHVSKGSMRGKYKAGGELLGFPIKGDGTFNGKLRNLKVKVNNYYDLVKRDGKEYVKLKKYTFDFEIVDHAEIHMTNLFDGNKELSDAMLNLINTNWRQLFPIFGKPLVDAIVLDVFNNVDNFFGKIPIRDILDF